MSILRSELRALKYYLWWCWVGLLSKVVRYYYNIIEKTLLDIYGLHENNDLYHEKMNKMIR